LTLENKSATIIFTGIRRGSVLYLWEDKENGFLYKCSSRYAKSSILDIIGYVCSLFLNNCKSVGIGSYLNKAYSSTLSLIITKIITKAVFFVLLFFLSTFLFSNSVYSQQVTCNGLPATIVGTEGDDVIDGTDNPDVISSLGGNDIINGLGGDDTICGGDGADTINGGDGKDTIFGENGSDLINGDNGIDNLDGGEDDDEINGGEGNDIIKGQSGNDTLRGNEGDDNIEGNEGEDNIEGNTGKDTINGGDDNDTIDGGEGDDLLEGGDGDDEINGGAGKDDILGQLGDDTLRGGENSDNIEGNEGDDLLEGNGGKDTLNGGPNNDTIIAGDGNDTLDGGANIDTLDGGLGKNTCIDGEFNTNCDTETGGETELTPPTITIDTPSDLIISEAIIGIIASYSDPSGIDTNFVKILVDAQDITSTCTVNTTQTTCTSPALSEDTHAITAVVRDIPGNTAQQTFNFTVFLDTTPPEILVEFVPVPNQSGWNNTNVTLIFGCSDQAGSEEFTNSGIASCTDPVTLENEGENQSVLASAVDNSGNTTSTTVIVNIDKTQPILSNLSPDSNTILKISSASVSGTVNDSLSGISSVTCNSNPATLDASDFNCDINLIEGSNTIEIAATDIAGNINNTSLVLSFQPSPDIEITSPVNLSTVISSPLAISGTVDTSASSVEINGVSASISGTTFSANVPIEEGINTITAVATDNNNRAGTDSIQIFLDTTPPNIIINSPEDNFTTNSPSLNVSGIINDIGANGNFIQASVNNIIAEVSNGTFIATDIQLNPGSNIITVEAEDINGNTSSASITVTFDDFTGQPKINLVSGNNQSAIIGGQLQEPVIVSLLDSAGSPVPNQNVVFKIIRNDGYLTSTTETGRTLIVPTNSQGQAEVFWNIGSSAGVGGNILEATATGFSGKVLINATGISSFAEKINLDSGNNQVGVIGQSLPFALVVVVTDISGNRIPDIPVTFTATEGGGSFDGNSSVTANTDEDGFAKTIFTVGAEEGIENNVVEATFTNNPGFPAVFTASAKVSGDATNTQLTGVVLDNTNIPIEGVTISIEDTTISTQTDSQGQFIIAPAPVGHIEIIADGSTANRPGSWPSLEFQLVTISGQDNSLPMPIFLLPLDIPNGLFVDENNGGILQVPQLPGFSLNIQPGSATFPDGSKSGTVSATLVHSDKIPMTPNMGQQPRFIVTIQPPGVNFDPPAKIRMPNVDNLQPGQIVEIYSFDHDLARFITVATGIVDESGAFVESEASSGIIEGGWHCCGKDPPPPGVCCDCSECKECSKIGCLNNNSLIPEQIVGNCKDEICNQGRRKINGPNENDKPSDPDLDCCNDEIYDTQDQCCLKGAVFGIQTDWVHNKCDVPIIDYDDKCINKPLEFCPNRVPRPGIYDPSRIEKEYNGCSVPDELIALLASIFGIQIFLIDIENPAGGIDTHFSHKELRKIFPDKELDRPCDNHDICYGDCVTPRNVCDDNMHNEGMNVCFNSQEEDFNKIFNCFQWIDAYMFNIRTFGEGAFESENQRGCICCPL